MRTEREKWIRSVLTAAGLITATLVGVGIQPSWAACGCGGGATCTCTQEECGGDEGGLIGCDCFGAGCTQCGLKCVQGNPPCGGTAYGPCTCGDGAYCPCQDGYRCQDSQTGYQPCGGTHSTLCACGLWWCQCFTTAQVCREASSLDCGGNYAWHNCECDQLVPIGSVDCPTPYGACLGEYLCVVTNHLWTVCTVDANGHCSNGP